MNNASAVSSTTALFNRLQASATQVRAWTGKEVGFVKTECGKHVKALNLENNEHIQFFRDFINLGLATSDYFQSAVEAMAKKYAQLQAELSVRYGNNENSLYEQLSNLNTGFEQALRNAIVWFLYVPDDKNDGNILECARTQIANQVDCFFERFIRCIRQGDFNTALREAMEESGLWPEGRANPTLEIDMSMRLTFNIKGGLLIVTFCEDGIMTVQIVRGGEYGYTNEELAYNDTYEETEDMESDGVETANNPATPGLRSSGNTQTVTSGTAFA